MAKHERQATSLFNRIWYSKKDPLRYQRVSRSQQLDEDPPEESYPPVEIDLQWYRDHPDG